MKVSDASQIIPESLWMIGNPDILSKMPGEDIDSIYNALADLMDREEVSVFGDGGVEWL